MGTGRGRGSGLRDESYLVLGFRVHGLGFRV